MGQRLLSRLTFLREMLQAFVLPCNASIGCYTVGGQECTTSCFYPVPPLEYKHNRDEALPFVTLIHNILTLWTKTKWTLKICLVLTPCPPVWLISGTKQLAVVVNPDSIASQKSKPLHFYSNFPQNVSWYLKNI